MIGKTNARIRNKVAASIVVSAPQGSTVSCDGLTFPEERRVNPAWIELPARYTEYDSLKGDGATGYIDINGIQLTQDSKIYGSFTGCTQTTATKIFFEAGYWASGVTCQLVRLTSSDDSYHTYITPCRVINGSLYQLNDTTNYGSNVTFTWDKLNMTVNGVSQGTFPSATYTTESGYPLRLFAGIDADKTASNFADFAMKEFQVYQNDVLTLDLVCCKNASNVIGVYDVVNSNFYAATGTLTPGNEIPQYLDTSTYKGDVAGFGYHDVSATLDGTTLTESVYVDEGKEYEVDFEGLVVDNTTYLYYLGTDNTDLTGGWAGYPSTGDSSATHMAPTVTMNSDHVSIGRAERMNGAGATVNAIDITDYSMVALCQTHEGISFTNYGNLSICIGKMESSELGRTAGASFMDYAASPNISGLITLDISSYTGTYYPHIYEWLYSSNGYVLMQSMALAKPDDISRLSAYGATISAILANSATLLASESGVNAMLKCTGDFMWSALTNSTFLTAYKSSTYKSVIDADERWAKAIALLDYGKTPVHPEIVNRGTDASSIGNGRIYYKKNSGSAIAVWCKFTDSGTAMFSPILIANDTTSPIGYCSYNTSEYSVIQETFTMYGKAWYGSITPYGWEQIYSFTPGGNYCYVVNNGTGVSSYADRLTAMQDIVRYYYGEFD